MHQSDPAVLAITKEQKELMWCTGASALRLKNRIGPNPVF